MQLMDVVEADKILVMVMDVIIVHKVIIVQLTIVPFNHVLLVGGPVALDDLLKINALLVLQANIIFQQILRNQVIHVDHVMQANGRLLLDQIWHHYVLLKIVDQHSIVMVLVLKQHALKDTTVTVLKIVYLVLLVGGPVALDYLLILTALLVMQANIIFHQRRLKQVIHVDHVLQANIVQLKVLVQIHVLLVLKANIIFHQRRHNQVIHVDHVQQANIVQLKVLVQIHVYVAL